MNSLDLAVHYSEKLSACKTIGEIELIGSQIKTDKEQLGEYLDWLRCEYASARDTTLTPEYKPEDMLNKIGLRALKEGKF